MDVSGEEPAVLGCSSSAEGSNVKGELVVCVTPFSRTASRPSLVSLFVVHSFLCVYVITMR